MESEWKRWAGRALLGAVLVAVFPLLVSFFVPSTIYVEIYFSDATPTGMAMNTICQWSISLAPFRMAIRMTPARSPKMALVSSDL